MFTVSSFVGNPAPCKFDSWAFHSYENGLSLVGAGTVKAVRLELDSGSRIVLLETDTAIVIVSTTGSDVVTGNSFIMIDVLTIF